MNSAQHIETKHIEAAFPFVNAAEKKAQDAISELMALPTHSFERMVAAKEADYAIANLLDELTRLRTEIRKMY